MPTPPIVFVTRLLPEPVMAALRSRYRIIDEPGMDSPAHDALRRGFARADAVVSTLTERIDRGLLNAAPALKIVANYAVGYNNIDVESARGRGIIVTNTPDVLTDATADLTWGLILAVARRLGEGERLVRSGRWTGWAPTQLLGAEVSGKTLGLVGMGRIGGAVARRAAGFAMRILYYSRSTVAPPSPACEARPLEDLLRESDFLSLHVPLTSETYHLVGEAELARMKPTAYLINTSRGPVVDETALVHALRAGRLAGAGLDVYEREPALEAGLSELPQVVLLPHLGSATLETRIRMGMICVRNIDEVLAGRPAPNPVP